MTSCPRCGEGVAAGQEYCLECGLRLPGASRLGAAPADPRRLALPLVLAAVIAAGGAAVAIALTRETATATPIVTATGGSEVVPTPTVADVTRLAQWPRRYEWLDEHPRFCAQGHRSRCCRGPRRPGAQEGLARRRRARLLPLRQSSPGLLDGVLRGIPERARGCEPTARGKDCPERRPHRSASAGDFVVHIDNLGVKFVTRSQTGYTRHGHGRCRPVTAY